jgi:acyl carrier protein
MRDSGMKETAISRDGTMERVRKVLIEEFELKAEDLTPAATLYEELGLDSLDSVDMVVALEKEFGFKVVRAVDEEKIRAIRDVAALCGFVEYKLIGKETTP